MIAVPSGLMSKCPLKEQLAMSVPQQLHCHWDSLRILGSSRRCKSSGMLSPGSHKCGSVAPCNQGDLQWHFRNDRWCQQDRGGRPRWKPERQPVHLILHSWTATSFKSTPTKQSIVIIKVIEILARRPPSCFINKDEANVSDDCTSSLASNLHDTRIRCTNP